MSDLFGVSGRELLATAALAVESRSRVDSLLRVITALDFEIDLYAKLVAGRLRTDPGYQAIQQIPGVGPMLGAVFVAEIGDITRFHRPQQLASLGRVDPQTPRVRHHRAPRPDHQTGLSAGALGRGRGRATRARAHPPRAAPGPGRRTPRPQHRRRGRRPRPDHAGLLRATGSPRPLPAHEGGGVTGPRTSWWARIVAVMTPEPARRGRPV